MRIGTPLPPRPLDRSNIDAAAKESVPAAPEPRDAADAPSNGASPDDERDDAYRPIVLPPDMQRRHDEVASLIAASVEAGSAVRDGMQTPLPIEQPGTHDTVSTRAGDAGFQLSNDELRIIEITIDTTPAPDPLDVTGDTTEDNNGDENPISGDGGGNGGDNDDVPSSSDNPDAVFVTAGQATLAQRIAIVAATSPGLRGLPPPARLAIAAVFVSIGFTPGERDSEVYDFQTVDNAAVLLPNDAAEPGELHIDGAPTGVLVRPVRDTDGSVTGFAPDSVYDQVRVHEVSGYWIALAEDGSSADAPVTQHGEGSVRGARKSEDSNNESNRIGAKGENDAAEILAGVQGRNLERVPDHKKGDGTDGGKGRPDMIDLDTKEKIEVLTPTTPSVVGIRRGVSEKIREDRGEVIVVNTNNTPLSDEVVVDTIENMSGRKQEIIVINDDGVTKIIPPNVFSAESRALGTNSGLPEKAA